MDPEIESIIHVPIGYNYCNLLTITDDYYFF